MLVGQKAFVTAFSYNTAEGETTQEIGLTPGEQLEIVRRSPDGDSIEIKIRGYFISLSKQEADLIKVEPCL